MPDDRFLHKRLGHSEKISQLTDFEFRVWTQYLVSSDDFGVMRFSAITLQSDCDAFALRSSKQLQKALDRVADAKLIATFPHQGRIYCYQRDWQDWQKVDYPRGTLHPAPPLGDLSEKTRELFTKHPGGWGKKVRGTSGEGSPNIPQPFAEHSENVPQTFDERSGEITRKPVAVSRKPVACSREPVAEDSPPREEATDRVQAFVDWYSEKHKQLFGVAYMGNPRSDYERTCEMVGKFTDADLRDGALVWFGQEDKFATDGTRSIPKFASRASDCVLQAKRVAL